MKTSKITNETIVQVHFNDINVPTEMTYMVYIDGKPVVLADEGADKNALVDIRELAGFEGEPDPYHDYESEMQESDYEAVHNWYYEVKNENFPIPFTDDDIPSHLYELGILEK